jgi:hypothetical protein
LLRLFRPLTVHPRFAFAARRISSFPPLFSHCGVALLFGVDEFLPRVTVVPAWPPIAAANAVSLLSGA